MRRTVLLFPPLLLLLGACGGGDHVHPATLPAYASLRVPDSSVRVAYEERERLIAECMTARGFPYARAAFVARPPELTNDERRWGPLNAAAVVNGYHPGPAILAMTARSDRQQDKSQAALDAVPAARRDAYSRALTGIPDHARTPPPDTREKLPDGTVVTVSTPYLPGSCHDEADRRLYADAGATVTRIRATRQLVEDMRQSADARAMADDEFVAVVKAWSDCFAESGFEGPDPLRALETYYARGDVPDARERQAATADVACKERTGLWATWQRLLDREWRKEAAKHGEVVLAYAELQQRLTGSLL